MTQRLSRRTSLYAASMAHDGDAENLILPLRMYLMTMLAKVLNMKMTMMKRKKMTRKTPLKLCLPETAQSREVPQPRLPT